MNTRIQMFAAVALVPVLMVLTVPTLSGAEPPADTRVPAVIRVIVDHSNHLALIPEGTLLPANLVLFAAQERPEGTESSAPDLVRPLTLAWAPAERFAGMAVDSEHEQVPEIDPSLGDRDGVPLGLQSVQVCPFSLIVEFGPGMTHYVTCNKWPGIIRVNGVNEAWYPTTSLEADIWWNLNVPGRPSKRIRPSFPCYPSQGHCLAQWGADLGVPGATFDNVARVRLPGACTPDPPSCPTYISVVSIPLT